jgi:adenylate kinase
MIKGVAFIGGIHGVGKSTICKTVCSETGLLHLTASEVLKWKDISENTADKAVVDILDTQDRLVVGLRSIVHPENKYLLDGHYCLLNKMNAIEKVPLKTFRQINPFFLSLITDDILAIKDRLEARDGKLWDVNLLNEMQEQEVFHAKEISAKLNIKLNICAAKNFRPIINDIKILKP